MTQTYEPTEAQQADVSKGVTASDCQPPLSTNLAALLDRFTRSIADAASHTVGEFASTVEALHTELSMLSGTIHGRAASFAQDAIDFDDIFPDDSNELPGFDPAYHGIAASEELEHTCRQIARSR